MLPGTYEGAAPFKITVDVEGGTDSPAEEIQGLPTELTVDPPGEPGQPDASSGPGGEASRTADDGDQEEPQSSVPGPAVLGAVMAGVAAATVARRHR